MYYYKEQSPPKLSIIAFILLFLITDMTNAISEISYQGSGRNEPGKLFITIINLRYQNGLTFFFL
jgi:hypothetical protein